MENPDSAKGLIETIEVKTQAARLRAIMPDILRRIDEGVSHEQIVEALNRGGQFDLNLGTFRKYLYRYRKKLRQQPKSGKPAVETAARTNGNLSSELVQDSDDETQGDETKTDSEKLAEVLSARNRDTLGDNYLNRSRPILGKSRSKNK